MPKIPPFHPHRSWRRPWHKSVWARCLPSLLATLFLAACANAAGPPAPEALTIQQSEEQLALHGEATDGCAYGASGGVGTFTVQIAKSFGADVTGVCSTRNVNMVGSIGADHVIDYTQEDFTQSGQRYDFILDIAGNRLLSDCRRALTPNGILIPIGGPAGLGRVFKMFVSSLFVRQQGRPFVSLPNNEDLVVLKELVDSGKVTPVIDRTYSLARTAARAHTSRALV